MVVAAITAVQAQASGTCGSRAGEGMKILVVNCGSSSLKYRLFDMDSEAALAKGLVERIGEPQGARYSYESGAAILSGAVDAARP